MKRAEKTELSRIFHKKEGNGGKPSPLRTAKSPSRHSAGGAFRFHSESLLYMEIELIINPFAPTRGGKRSDPEPEASDSRMISTRNVSKSWPPRKLSAPASRRKRSLRFPRALHGTENWKRCRTFRPPRRLYHRLWYRLRPYLRRRRFPSRSHGFPKRWCRRFPNRRKARESAYHPRLRNRKPYRRPAPWMRDPCATDAEESDDIPSGFHRRKPVPLRRKPTRDPLCRNPAISILRNPGRTARFLRRMRRRTASRLPRRKPVRCLSRRTKPDPDSAASGKPSPS